MKLSLSCWFSFTLYFSSNQLENGPDFRHRSQYVTCADLARCQGSGSRCIVRCCRPSLHCSVQATRDLEQAQRAQRMNLFFNQRPVVRAVAREMPVTPAEVTCDSDSYSLVCLSPGQYFGANLECNLECYWKVIEFYPHWPNQPLKWNIEHSWTYSRIRIETV